MTQFVIEFDNIHRSRVTCIIMAASEAEAVNEFHAQYFGRILTIREITK
jgi:hypothetical protein